jgi:S-adenosylmethionine:tRNA ribosyltransferase-isomerase
VLLLEERGDFWLAMVGGKTKLGDKVTFSKKLKGEVVEKNNKEAVIVFDKKGPDFWQMVEEIGKTPIPPYIKHTKLSERELREAYQTVYSGEYGSAAAPTAGLHFSKKQIGELLRIGVEVEYINLNIGLGTFAPLTSENLFTKKLHSEKFQIPYSAIKKIIQTKSEGGRVFAVGTTTVRALESVAEKILDNKSKITGITDSTEIFIQPGFKFKIVDSLITNFHLPSSSLMMLVSALIQDKGIKDGREKLLEIYQYAINKEYRFYSFGDAMLLL